MTRTDLNPSAAASAARLSREARTMVDPALAERFRRLIGSPRVLAQGHAASTAAATGQHRAAVDAAADDDDSGVSAMPPLPPMPLHGAGDDPGPQQHQAGQGTEPEPPRWLPSGLVPAPAGTPLRDAADSRNTAAPQPEGEAGAHAASTESIPAWLQETADFVLSLCSGGHAAFQSWRLTVPLNPHQLPDSLLSLDLSAHALRLCFSTPSPESARLVLCHRQQLQALLAELPGLPADIAIDLDSSL